MTSLGEAELKVANPVSRSTIREKRRAAAQYALLLGALHRERNGRLRPAKLPGEVRGVGAFVDAVEQEELLGVEPELAVNAAES